MCHYLFVVVQVVDMEHVILKCCERSFVPTSSNGTFSVVNISCFCFVELWWVRVVVGSCGGPVPCLHADGCVCGLVVLCLHCLCLWCVYRMSIARVSHVVNLRESFRSVVVIVL